MTTISVLSSPVDVYVYKSCLNGSPTSKNFCGDLLKDAGYNKPAKDGIPRKGIVQGGIRFLNAKDPRAISVNMELSAQQGCGFIAPANALREAWLSQSAATLREMTLLFSLGVGPCNFRMSAPPDTVKTIKDLQGSTIFTEYPKTLAALLKFWGITESTLYDTTGADEIAARNRGISFDITETGNAARELGYEILNELPYPGPEQLGPLALPFPGITTDVYGWNVQNMPESQRDCLEAFALAIESATRERTFRVLGYALETRAYYL